MGEAVTRVQVGDRVAIEPGTPCRDCADCHAGDYHLCPDLRFLATPPYDGALIQNLVIDERNLFGIPDSMSMEAAAMCEPLSVGIWAAHRAGLKAGDRVRVVGAGPVGILAAQVARALGASDVVVSDISEYRLGVAERLGLRTEHAGAVEPGPGHEDCDVLLECSGAPGALAAGLLPEASLIAPLRRARLGHLWPVVAGSGRWMPPQVTTTRAARAAPPDHASRSSTPGVHEAPGRPQPRLRAIFCTVFQSPSSRRSM